MLTEAKTYDFLEKFSPYATIKDLVSDDTVDSSKVFPLNEPYKISYSLRCLTELLQEQTDTVSAFETQIIQRDEN